MHKLLPSQLFKRVLQALARCGQRRATAPLKCQVFSTKVFWKSSKAPNLPGRAARENGLRSERTRLVQSSHSPCAAERKTAPRRPRGDAYISVTMQNTTGQDNTTFPENNEVAPQGPQVPLPENLHRSLS